MSWLEGYSMHGGMMMFGMIFFWVVLLCLGFYMMRNYANGNNKSTTSNNPNDILKERLAKGEISEDEYDRLREKIAR
jgi:putative membrane protein